MVHYRILPLIYEATRKTAFASGFAADGRCRPGSGDMTDWVFLRCPHMEDALKWMVWEKPLKWMIWGIPIFGNLLFHQSWIEGKLRKLQHPATNWKFFEVLQRADAPQDPSGPQVLA